MIERLRRWLRRRRAGSVALPPGIYLVSYAGMGVANGSEMELRVVRSRGGAPQVVSRSASTSGEPLYGKIVVPIEAGDALELVGVQRLVVDRLE